MSNIRTTKLEGILSALTNAKNAIYQAILGKHPATAATQQSGLNSLANAISQIPISSGGTELGTISVYFRYEDSTENIHIGNGTKVKLTGSRVGQSTDYEWKGSVEFGGNTDSVMSVLPGVYHFDINDPDYFELESGYTLVNASYSGTDMTIGPGDSEIIILTIRDVVTPTPDPDPEPEPEPNNRVAIATGFQNSALNGEYTEVRAADDATTTAHVWRNSNNTYELRWSGTIWELRVASEQGNGTLVARCTYTADDRDLVVPLASIENQSQEAPFQTTGTMAVYGGAYKQWEEEISSTFVPTGTVYAKDYIVPSTTPAYTVEDAGEIISNSDYFPFANNVWKSITGMYIYQASIPSISGQHYTIAARPSSPITVGPDFVPYYIDTLPTGSQTASFNSGSNYSGNPPPTIKVYTPSSN